MDGEWIVPGKNRRLVRTGGGDRRVKFTPARRELFLENLAASCNVTASAAAAGVSFSAAYRCRMRDPEFRAAWAEAIDQGYAMLEAGLLEQAMRRRRDAEAEEDEAAGPEEPPEVDWDKALQLLRNRQGGNGGGGEGQRAPRRVPVEELAANLIRRMKALGVKRPGEGGEE